MALVGNSRCRHPRLSYRQLFSLADQFGAGLLELGLKPGEHAALFAENSDLWLIANLGIIGIGALDVPRGGTAPAEELSFCLQHGRCPMAIVEDEHLQARLSPLPAGLRALIVLRGAPGTHALSFDQVMDLGKARLARNPAEFSALQESITPDHLCTIIYTSGTTGDPKGVMLTHGNILHNIRVIPEVLPFKEGQGFLSFLPSWHTFERTIEYIVLDHGMQLHYGSKRRLKQDFKRVRPSFVVGVPRIYELFCRSVMEEIDQRRGAAGYILRGALEGSRVFMNHIWRVRGWEIRPDGRVVRPHAGHYLGLALLALLLGPAHLLAEATVYRKLRQAFGGRVKAAISGGGPLAPDVDSFLNRAGLPLMNGYGLTESSPILCVRRLWRNPQGSIGAPIPETEIRIANSKGEALPPGRKGAIQARGPQIMRGYFQNTRATKKTLLDGGWLDTGDTGFLSSAGDLVIAGRTKDTIVLSGGENVEPEPLEQRLLASPFIEDAVVVGHGKKVLGVLLVPALKPLVAREKLPPETSLEELIQMPAVRTRLKEEVARIVSPDTGCRGFERIGGMAFLSKPFSETDGTLTGSLKKRRAVIEKIHAGLIDSLYH